jgi:hypothetical protein
MACALTACGGRIFPDQASPDAGASGVAAAAAGGQGSIRAQIQLPAGALVSSLTYTLTGPGGFARSSTQPLAGRQGAFQMVGIPAPGRYALDINGTSADGSEDCSSSALFDVAPSKVTVVVLIVTCSGT